MRARLDPAEVVFEPRCDKPAAVGHEQVGARGQRDPPPVAHTPDDLERLDDRVGHRRRRGFRACATHAGQEKSVDPLAVGSPLDVRGDYRTNEGEQLVLHLAESGQRAVVSESDARALEVKGMEVLLVHSRTAIVEVLLASNVCYHAVGSDLVAEAHEVAVVRREGQVLVNERDRRLRRPGIPRREAAPRQVQEVQHRRVVDLPRKRAVGVEQQHPQGHGLS